MLSYRVYLAHRSYERDLRYHTVIPLSKVIDKGVGQENHRLKNNPQLQMKRHDLVTCSSNKSSNRVLFDHAIVSLQSILILFRYVSNAGTYKDVISIL